MDAHQASDDRKEGTGGGRTAGRIPDERTKKAGAIVLRLANRPTDLLIVAFSRCRFAVNGGWVHATLVRVIWNYLSPTSVVKLLGKINGFLGHTTTANRPSACHFYLLGI